MLFGGFQVEQNVFPAIGEKDQGNHGAIATGSLPQLLKEKMLVVKYTLLSAACHGLPMQKFIVKTCENTYGEITNAPEKRNSKKNVKLTMQH